MRDDNSWKNPKNKESTTREFSDGSIVDVMTAVEIKNQIFLTI